MRIVRPLVQTLGDLQLTVRNLGRMREVARVLVKHGLGGLVRGVPDLDVDADAAPGPTTPERIVAALQELGPTYVKLGQVLSTRPDVLPPDYIEALQRLQDGVAPVPWEAIEEVLVDELGADWLAAFSAFEETPLATASIAQVHTATLIDGSDVVLKIQRPGIAVQIEADLHILEFLAVRALEEYPESRAMDPMGLLREFERTMRAELDFRREAENMARFKLNFAEQPHVHVPSVVDAMVTSRVLCMERLVGVPMRHAREAGHDMELVGKRYLDVVFDMLLVHGFFHGDLHPGNVLVLPGEHLGLLDFGMVGTMTDRMRNDLVTMMFALRRGDHRTIARVLYDIAIRDERLDFRRVEQATIEVVERHFPSNAQLKDIEMSGFAMELVTRSAGLGARIPTSYMMVLKALVTMEGLAKTLLEEVDPIAAAEPYFVNVLTRRMAPEKMQQEAFYALLTLSSLLDRLPISLAQLLDDLDEQRLHVGLRHNADPRELAQKERLTDRALVGGFAMACVIGGALAGDVGPAVLGVSVASWVLWSLATVSVLLVLGMMVTGWRSRS